jgi:hypothetical protein
MNSSPLFINMTPILVVTENAQMGNPYTSNSRGKGL